MGLAIVVGSACNGSGGLGDGNGEGGQRVRRRGRRPRAARARTSSPTRASPAPSGRIARRFTAVAATPSTVIATTGYGLHHSKDGGDTWSFVDANEVRGQRIVAIAAFGSDLRHRRRSRHPRADLPVHRRRRDVGRRAHAGRRARPTTSPSTARASSPSSAARLHEWNATASTWVALPPAEEMFDVIESDGTSLYANAIYTPGVYRLRLDDLSAQWTRVEGLSQWGYTAFAFTSKGAFASTRTHIFRSDDGGETWATLDAGG